MPFLIIFFKYRLFHYLHIELSACREMSAVIPINLVILVGFFLMHLFRDIVFEVWIIQGSFCSEQTMQDQSNQ